MTLLSSADAVVHNGAVIVGQAADQPIRLRNPIVITRAARLDVLVMNSDELVAIPTLVLVEEAEGMAEFVRRHPWPLAPPERGDVDVGTNAFLETDQAGVVPAVGIAGEANAFHLRRARNERYVRARVRPALHRSQGNGLLCRCQFGDVIGNDAARPRLRLFRISLHVRRVGVGGSRQRRPHEDHEDTQAHQRKAKG